MSYLLLLSGKDLDSDVRSDVVFMLIKLSIKGGVNIRIIAVGQ